MFRYGLGDETNNPREAGLLCSQFIERKVRRPTSYNVRLRRGQVTTNEVWSDLPYDKRAVPVRGRSWKLESHKPGRYNVGNLTMQRPHHFKAVILIFN